MRLAEWYALSDEGVGCLLNLCLGSIEALKSHLSRGSLKHDLLDRLIQSAAVFPAFSPAQLAKIRAAQFSDDAQINLLPKSLLTTLLM